MCICASVVVVRDIVALNQKEKEERRGEERIVNGYEKDAQYNFELQFSESSFPWWPPYIPLSNFVHVPMLW